MRAYFDHNASSPLLPEVFEAMRPYLLGVHGNPSSLHQSGRLAKSAIESARLKVAQKINCQPQQVIFVAGGTEANNYVLQAMQHLNQSIGRVEHASIIEPAIALSKNTSKLINWVEVNEQGLYDSNHKLSEGFASLQLVNNETGVIQPIFQIKANNPKVLIHTDASQAMGKIAVDFKALNVDFMTLSAHKFKGPKGIGALIVKNISALNSVIKGGKQEQNKRAGTENVAAIVGMGKAIECIQNDHSHVSQLMSLFESQLSSFKNLTIFSKQASRVANTCYFALPYFHGETLLMEADKAGFELASGSACHSQVTEPSHVLKAMQVEEGLALNAIRVSFGQENTFEEVDGFLHFLQHRLENLPAVIKSAVGQN